MPEPKLEQNSYDTWRDLVNSDDWWVFKELLEEHKEYLNLQALNELEKREFDKAFTYKIRAKECGAILQLVADELERLKGKEKENVE